MTAFRGQLFEKGARKLLRTSAEEWENNWVMFNNSVTCNYQMVFGCFQITTKDMTLSNPDKYETDHVAWFELECM